MTNKNNEMTTNHVHTLGVEGGPTAANAAALGRGGGLESEHAMDMWG